MVVCILHHGRKHTAYTCGGGPMSQHEAAEAQIILGTVLCVLWNSGRITDAGSQTLLLPRPGLGRFTGVATSAKHVQHRPTSFARLVPSRLKVFSHFLPFLPYSSPRWRTRTPLALPAIHPAYQMAPPSPPPLRPLPLASPPLFARSSWAM